MAEPVDWWLSADAVNEQEGRSPNWGAIAEKYGILDYIPGDSDRVTKALYKAGVERYLQEVDGIVYGEPECQTLRDPKWLISYLPTFYLLPAITDYSSEIDRRSSSTIFHRLISSLGDRILRADPRYNELEKTILIINQLLNPTSSETPDDDHTERLEILEMFEKSLQEAVSRLIPAVNAVHLQVTLDNVRDLIAKGVSIEIDDGVRTDVLSKGHGLQRCMIFGLLQILISVQRGDMYSHIEDSEQSVSPIILAVEEPELYIHPQGKRMVFKALRDFANSDQVIYSTHEPDFIDVGNYQRIALVSKNTPTEGTRVRQCDEDAITLDGERKRFQLISSFTADWNRIFFAKHVVLIEGEVDKIALLAVGRELGFFDEIPEEIDYTIVVAGNKDEIPKLQKLLNPFEIPYTIMHELDGAGEAVGKNKEILELLGANKRVKIPTKLEEISGLEGHIGAKYTAMRYFSNPENITDDLRQVVRAIFTTTDQ